MRVLPYNQADNTSLPMTFTFNFTGASLLSSAFEISSYTTASGTEFNVVGDDWRDGILLFTLDGNQLPPHDLSSATDNIGTRCRFPWYTSTDLSPTEHSFTFSLIAPSRQVAHGWGDSPGNTTAYYVRFFYFSYGTTRTIWGRAC